MLRILSLFVLVTLVLAEDCSNFNQQNACRDGRQTDNDPSWINRQWQTPPKGDPLYRTEYQSMNELVGYARLTYNADKTSALVTIITQTNPRVPNSDKLVFSFNGKEPTTNNVYKATTQDKLVTVKVMNKITGASLVIDDVYFIWSRPAVSTPNQYESGQKGAIVELFGWPYADIAKECEMIGKAGYLGVKVYPAQEFIVSWSDLQGGELNPWYFMYQPVSYRLNSRWGTRKDLVTMIETCRSFGVRVYTDAVVNHMTGNGNDVFTSHRNDDHGKCTYWGAKNATAGSPYFTQGFGFKNVSFTKNRPGMEFPAVPYGPLDFHCERGINAWTDPFQLNYGYLLGLSDLNTERDYVRQRIADYFTDLLSVGFSGFRIDAAKHISPDNLAAIFKKFKDNLGGGELPQDFITYLEVIIGGEKDLLMCSMNPYNYGPYFSAVMKKTGLSESDIFKVKIWSSDYPKEFPICGSWVIPSEREAVSNDCHDDQFPGSATRDMGDTGSVLVKEKNVTKHRNFEKLLFSRTDGNWKIRLVLSSYTFMDDAFGPPDGLSDCSLCKGPSCSQCKTMKKSVAHNPNTCGYTCEDASGKWIQGVYTRVHRDLGIVLAMRKWMGLPPISAQEAGLPSTCHIRPVAFLLHSMDTVHYSVSFPAVERGTLTQQSYNVYNYGFYTNMEQATLVDHANNLTPIKKIATLGRDAKDDLLRDFYSLDVSIDDPRVSHKHCTLVFDEWKKQFVLINHSKNGTMVNDNTVLYDPYILHNDDRIVLNKKNPNTAFLFKAHSL